MTEGSQWAIASNRKKELQTCHIFTILTSIGYDGYEPPSPTIHHQGHVLRAVQGIHFSNGASKRRVALFSFPSSADSMLQPYLSGEPHTKICSLISGSISVSSNVLRSWESWTKSPNPKSSYLRYGCEWVCLQIYLPIQGLFPVDSAWYWQGDKGEYGVHTPGGEAACRMPTLPIWPVEAHHPHQNHHYLLLLSSSSSSSSLSCMVFWNTTWQRLKTWPRHRSTRMTHVLPRPSQGGKRTATSPWCQASKWSHSNNQLEHQHLKLTQLGFLIPLSCFDIRHRKASARGCQIYRKRASSPNWLLLWNVGDKWNQIEIKVWAL